MYKLIPLLFFLCAFNLVNAQESLISNWRRMHPAIKKVGTQNKEMHPGDLSIFSDSTFIIYGDSTGMKSTLPGWSSLDEYKGTWSCPDSNHLTLLIILNEKRMPMPYKIITLTKQRLVLRAAYSEKKSKYSDMSFFRL